MARRRGFDKAAVVDAALSIADREGADAVTLARVADELGISPPSLYSHVSGLPGLRRDLALHLTVEFGECLRDAAMGVSGDDALRAVAAAYRRYGSDHPGRYQLTFWPMDPDDTERADAGRRAQQAVAAVIRSYGLDPATARRAGRAFRASMHGLVDLEHEGTTGLDDLEGAYSFLVQQFIHGLRTAAIDAPSVVWSPVVHSSVIQSSVI
jgi:AcrR family transcriptional regulator